MDKLACRNSNGSKFHDLKTSSQSHEKRIWLHKIGVFSFQPDIDGDGPNGEDGDCLFHCILQVLKSSCSNQESLSSELTVEAIRKSIVQHVTKGRTWNPKISNYWRTKLQSEQLLNLLFGSPAKKPSLKILAQHEKQIRQEYSARMSSTNECGTLFELNSACDLYQCQIDYLIQISKRHGLYKIFNCEQNDWKPSSNNNNNRTRARNYYLFYYKKYGSCACGHWQLLSPVVLMQPPPFPTHRKVHGQSYLYEKNVINQPRKFDMVNFQTEETLDHIACAFELRADKLSKISSEHEYNCCGNYEWPEEPLEDKVEPACPINLSSQQPNSTRKNLWTERFKTFPAFQFQSRKLRGSNKKYI